MFSKLETINGCRHVQKWAAESTTPVVEGDSGVENAHPTPAGGKRLTRVEITDFDKQENRTLTRSSSILGLNGTGSCLAVDWVGRFLYWAEHEDGLAGTVVKRLDLNRMRSSPITIFARPNPILKIEVSPLDSMLYWVELEPNHLGKLMKSPSDGSNIQQFFSKSSTRRSRNVCNCPESPNVGATITLDQSSHLRTDPNKEPELRLIWVDSAQNHIYDADLSGCSCSLLVNTSVVGNAGLPPTSITADHKLVYWSNATEGRVYSLAKAPRRSSQPLQLAADLTNGVTAFKASGVRSIAAVGQHLQPYPVARCLTPKEPGAAKMVNSTSDSITLELPTPRRDKDCGNVSLATVQFTVFYGVTTSADDTPTCLEDIKMCSFLKTFDRIVEVHGLQPYTNYSFFVAFENHYSELQGLPLVLGPSAVIQTTPGGSPLRIF
ncbi:hypothetical protein LSTR_LSTR014970 [Laodelphax striatellus]|uniref:Fibronectin type-III domain-containing protein n=1 Tax=Laodelphax striatellus TaxID=195883 RepID=A0A482XPL0_LAOST|nr:hypothetical protein LSTR_LSTR014970 [Laodelphax striatellus]